MAALRCWSAPDCRQAMNFILSAGCRQQSLTPSMETMMKINPYLTLNGDCKQAMEF
jgi:hypothetical protein